MVVVAASLKMTHHAIDINYMCVDILYLVLQRRLSVTI